MWKKERDTLFKEAELLYESLFEQTQWVNKQLEKIIEKYKLVWRCDFDEALPQIFHALICVLHFGKLAIVQAIQVISFCLYVVQ